MKCDVANIVMQILKVVVVGDGRERDRKRSQRLDEASFPIIRQRIS